MCGIPLPGSVFPAVTTTCVTNINSPAAPRGRPSFWWRHIYVTAAPPYPFEFELSARTDPKFSLRVSTFSSMPGRISKKKKSAQKKQAPARYVVPPMSPVVTRSGSRVADDNINNSATPTSLGPVISDDSVFIQSAVSQELKTMEAKWDTRFTRMEDNMRSALCNQSVNKLPSAASSPSPPLTTASAAGPTITTVESSSTSSARPGHASRGSSKSSRSPSSSSDSSTRSSSGHSSSRSKKRHRRSRRSRNRSRSRSAARDRRRKQGKYTSLKYLPGFTQVSSYERLVLANVRMALRFYKKDRDIKGILDHIILLAEKAEPGVFESDALRGDVKIGWQQLQPFANGCW